MIQNFTAKLISLAAAMSMAMTLSAATLALRTGATSHTYTPFRWAPQTSRQMAAPSTNLRPTKSYAQAPVSQGDVMLPAAPLLGVLEAPDGTDWFYTAEIDVEKIPLEGGYAYDENILGVKATIYDNSYHVAGNFEVVLPRLENSLKINQVEVAPTITRHFFNTDDNYEVMLMANYNFADYHTEQITLVYSLKPDGVQAELVQHLSGYYVNLADCSTEGNEDYYMVFYTGDDYDYDSWYLNFSLMAKATAESNGCRSLKSFHLDGMKLQGTGDEGAPFLLAAAGGSVYLAVGGYEKSYWKNPWDFEDNTVNPDNNLLIELYRIANETVEHVADTRIPIETNPTDCGFRFPWLGMFAGNYDMTFGQYDSSTDKPCYIITQQNLADNLEEGSYTFEVYNLAGKKLRSIVKDVMGYLYMSDIEGQPTQYCFLYAEEDGTQTMEFIDLPLCTVRGEMSRGTSQLEALTLDFDRVATPDGGYMYAGSLAYGLDDNEGNTLHRVVWYDSELNQDHIDYVNLGPRVQNAMVYISGKSLAPDFFCADQQQEYLFFIQRNEGNTEATSQAHTELVVVTENGENLVQIPFEPSAYQVTAMIANAATNPAICYMWQTDTDSCHMAFISLPLEGNDALTTVKACPTSLFVNDGTLYGPIGAEITVYDIAGREMLTGTLPLDLSPIASGTYVAISPDAAPLKFIR